MTKEQKIKQQEELVNYLCDSPDFAGTFVRVPKDNRPEDEIRAAEMTEAKRLYTESLNK